MLYIFVELYSQMILTCIVLVGVYQNFKIKVVTNCYSHKPTLDCVTCLKTSLNMSKI